MTNSAVWVHLGSFHCSLFSLSFLGMKTIKQITGVRGEDGLFSAIPAQDDELTPITEDQLWGAFRNEHAAGQTSPELDILKALDDGEAKLAKANALPTAKQRRVTTEELGLMVNGSTVALTPDEMQEVGNEATYQGWVTENSDGSYSLTEAGEEILATFQKR